MKYIKDIIYILIIVLLSLLLILSHIDDNFNILTSSDWVNLFVGLLSASATILLGVIAIYQNKKAHNINDRLLNIEEFNNKTFLYFENSVVPIKLVSDEYWEFTGSSDLKETINIEIMDNICLEEEHYLFVPTCQFFGRYPATDIVINSYTIEQQNINTGEISTIQTNSTAIHNQLQCCKENVTYEALIPLKFEENINKIITKDNNLIIRLNITVKNISGNANTYSINLHITYSNNNSDNNFFGLFNTTDKV